MTTQTFGSRQPIARAMEAYRLDPLTQEAADLVAAMCVRHDATFSRTIMPDGRVRVRMEFANGDSLGGLGLTTEDALAHLHARMETMPDA